LLLYIYPHVGLVFAYSQNLDSHTFARTTFSPWKFGACPNLRILIARGNGPLDSQFPA
jgi:hypothetical protein